MATYAIGDVQGCYQPLLALLQKINYRPDVDQLWFTGDLVNRGPESLAVLRFVKALGDGAVTVLGNHDLHLLAVALGLKQSHHSDTLAEILQAPDCEALLTWLRRRPILFHDAKLKYTLVHAGLPPQWDLSLAERCAHEVETLLADDNYADFIAHMYGDQPDCWQEALQGFDRFRFIVNAFTRLRFCYSDGRLALDYKGDTANKPSDLIPWFQMPSRKSQDCKIIFGHWAALVNDWDNLGDEKNIYPLDSGCVWGNCLTALRLEDQARFSVSCGQAIL